MTAALIPLAALLGLVVGLRVKQRRYLVERSKRVALEHRFDAYRLADTRTDLDVIGPISGQHQAVELYHQTDEETLPESPSYVAQALADLSTELQARQRPGLLRRRGIPDYGVVRHPESKWAAGATTSPSLPRALPGTYGRRLS